MSGYHYVLHEPLGLLAAVDKAAFDAGRDGWATASEVRFAYDGVTHGSGVWARNLYALEREGLLETADGYPYGLNPGTRLWGLTDVGAERIAPADSDSSTVGSAASCGCAARVAGLEAALRAAERALEMVLEEYYGRNAGYLDTLGFRMKEIALAALAGLREAPSEPGRQPSESEDAATVRATEDDTETVTPGSLGAALHAAADDIDALAEALRQFASENLLSIQANGRAGRYRALAGLRDAPPEGDVSQRKCSAPGMCPQAGCPLCDPDGAPPEHDEHCWIACPHDAPPVARPPEGAPERTKEGT